MLEAIRGVTREESGECEKCKGGRGWFEMVELEMKEVTEESETLNRTGRKTKNEGIRAGGGLKKYKWKLIHANIAQRELDLHTQSQEEWGC